MSLVPVWSDSKEPFVQKDSKQSHMKITSFKYISLGTQMLKYSELLTPFKSLCHDYKDILQYWKSLINYQSPQPTKIPIDILCTTNIILSQSLKKKKG